MKRAKSWYLSALAGALVASSVVLPASALIVVNTKSIISTQSASERASFATGNTVWTNLYTTNITVPAGQEGAYLRARFTAESSCTGGVGFCRVRIYVINAAGALVELEPASGNDYAFDSTDNGTATPHSAQGHAMERTSKEALPPGVYQVGVDVSVNTNAGINFTLDDWHFALELLAR
jgi:hypothetical protein